jgi:diaminohydroxyphosphoribosylaminopyrimidine deaminase / 5-amino-6-(5-phosphoribosylamino)uracil reductase
MSEEDDRLYMQRAIELARQGEGRATPNPLVGALLVLNGEVVGEGYHTFAEVKHAEVIALEQAGDRARGATLYCSLEPCCHYGRTSPCTDALLVAGISRAVIAIVDNDVRVSGRGIEQLRREGVSVSVGICQEEAFELNRSYFHAKSQAVPQNSESPSP